MGILIAAFIGNSLSCSLGLWYVVQRTKLCLDFSCTVHFLHLVICLWWNMGLPVTLTWWVINLVSVSLMCVTGEFLCMRTELRTIPSVYCTVYTVTLYSTILYYTVLYSTVLYCTV